MYNQQMFVSCRQQAKKTSLAMFSLIGLAIILMAAGLILRIKIMTFLGFILPLAAAYFVYDLFLAPCLRYTRHLADLLNGRSHQAAGVVRKVSDQWRLSEEGVRVRDVLILLDGDERETLFYWDDKLPLSALPVEKPISLIAYGRYITHIDP